MKRKTEEPLAGDTKRQDDTPEKTFHRCAPIVKDPTALRVAPGRGIRALEESRNFFFDGQNNLVYVKLEVKEPIYPGSRYFDQHSISCACVMDNRGQLYVSVHRDRCLYTFNIHDAAESNREPDEEGQFQVVVRGWYGEKTLVFERQAAKYIEMVRPDDLALSLNEDMLYVAAAKNSFDGPYCVKKIRVSDMTEVAEFGEDIIKWRLDGLAVLSTGQIAAGCGQEIWIFNEDGTVARKFRGLLDRRFKCIAVDADDNIYVTCKYDHAVVVFSVDGALIAQYGGDKAGEFSQPTRIAIDKFGRVAVTDGGCRLRFLTCE